MQTDFLILQNLAALYQKYISEPAYVAAIKDFWNRDPLSRLSFFLFRHNVSNAITYIDISRLPESSMAGIAAQTDDIGQSFYYHWDNGQKQLLFTGSYTEEGSYIHNNKARFLVYDKEALAAASFNDPVPGRRSGFKLQAAFIASCILFILLYADVAANRSGSLLLVQLSSLLNAGVAVILLFKERGIFHAFTERFCDAQAYTGCNKLLHSKASMLSGKLSLATSGTVIYISVFLYSLFAGTEPQYIHWAIWLYTLAVAVSLLLVIKMIAIRTFCKLCLWIHTVNLLTLIALCFLFPSPLADLLYIGYGAVFLMLACLMAASLLLLLLINYIDALQKDEAKHEEIGKLKSELLSAVLAKDKDERLQQANVIYRPLSFTFSDDNDLVLTLVLSTHCRFCSELINTVAQQHIREKIGRLEVYLYAAAEPDTLKLIHNLATATSETAALAVLTSWYKEDRLHPHEERVTAEKALPAFCLQTKDLPYAELPSVFINGVFIPHAYGASDLEKLLYYFSLPG